MLLLQILPFGGDHGIELNSVSLLKLHGLLKRMFLSGFQTMPMIIPTLKTERIEDLVTIEMELMKAGFRSLIL